jgi:hypothetical protein
MKRSLAGFATTKGFAGTPAELARHNCENLPKYLL